MASSTVPQAETTNALLICAKACELMATRLRIGSPLVGKWLGQLMTWMRVPSAVSANTASGLEFSPQMSPLIGPNAVWNAPNVSPWPPGMHEPFADRRHDLLVLADQRAVGADVELRIEHACRSCSAAFRRRPITT